ncbi:MAG: twin-arginine translocase TatA/TatE family subunit [Pseudomonadota bacterium]
MGGIGVWQVLLILAIVLIIFGAGKLPRVMGDFGKGLKSFKSGLKEDEEEGTSTEAQPQAARQIEATAEETAAPSAEGERDRATSN